MIQIKTIYTEGQTKNLVTDQDNNDQLSREVLGDGIEIDLKGVTDHLNNTMEEIKASGTIRNDKLHINSNDIARILKERGFISAFANP